jgi:hypothetical protein
MDRIGVQFCVAERNKDAELAVGLTVPRAPASRTSAARPPGTLAEGLTGPARPTPSPWWAEVAVVAAILSVAIVARRPGYLFSHAFWLDEGWVADSVRAPLHQLRLLSSSTPIGWTLLLRLVPDVGPPERLRILPLLFGGLSVVAAYLLGRRLGRGAALAAGLGAALAPTALRNHSLKQYSADAFVTLLLLWLTTRVEARWTRGRLGVLCLVCIPALLVSHAALFVSGAVLGALAVRALVERRWERLGWLVGLGAGVAAVAAAVYLAFAAAGNNDAMRRAWTSWMVPVGDGLGPTVAVVATRSADALGRVGFGPWPLAAAAVTAGLVSLWRARLPATAVAVCLLAVELVLAGATQRYPFLDERTSLFFTSLLTVCGGLGVFAVLRWSGKRPLTVPLGVVATVTAGVLLVPAAYAQAMQPMPASTVRQQVSYVLAHRRPGDVIVVGPAASFAFGYYWPERPTFVPATVPTAVLFQVEYPGHDDLVVVHNGRQPELIHGALREASARSSSGRVWVVLGEAGDRESTWRQASARVGRIAHRYPGLVLIDDGPGSVGG